jgi:hypothetical protein
VGVGKEEGEQAPRSWSPGGAPRTAKCAPPVRCSRTAPGAPRVNDVGQGPLFLSKTFPAAGPGVDEKLKGRAPHLHRAIVHVALHRPPVALPPRAAAPRERQRPARQRSRLAGVLQGRAAREGGGGTLSSVFAGTVTLETLGIWACARGAAARVSRSLQGAPPPPLRTKWTCRVPHPVLIGHAASLTPY